MSKTQIQGMSRSTILALAVAGVLGVTQVSQGQTRVDRSGANDANSRIGSNGRNDNRPPQPSPWEVNNAIIYGNVTGGKQFRGSLQSRDPREFRGNTGNRNVDNFVRDSAGVTTGGVTTFNANQTRGYFGDSRGVAPPPGLTGVTSLGGFSPPQPAAWRTVDPRLQSLSSGQVSTVIRPDQFGGPGPMDTQFAPNALTISPYTRQQAINPALLSDYTQLNRNGASSLTPGVLSDLQGLNQNATSGAGRNSQPGQSGAVNPAGGPQGDGPGPGAPGAINNAVNPTALPGTGASDAVRSGAVNNAISPAAGAEPGIRNKIVGMAEQSSVYGNLAAKKAEQDIAKRPGQSNEDASRAFNDQVRARAAKEKEGAVKDPGKTDAAAPGQNNAKPGNNNAGPTPPTPDNMMVKPGDLAPKADDLRVKPGDLLKPEGDNTVVTPPTTVAPLKVGSLAGSSGSKGLNELLAKAEAQMREGKFASAIESYDSAETLTPGNPLIKLGRAHAELGGQYYRRAEASLRKTLAGDKNLLAGQYDLKGMLGEERLAGVTKDLAELMTKNPNDVGAAVLLAYVYYNTGDERRAAAQLDLADKRANGDDQFVKLLKESWTLPQTGVPSPAPADNK